MIFKLLGSNLQEISHAIPIKKLPKVFQDAIHVSFELGISYLWIDSLCIIQDSEEDWAHESKRMGGVYSNGEFNIAATGYEDGLSGLFSERKPFRLMHTVLCPNSVLFDWRRGYKKKYPFKGIYIRIDESDFFQQVNIGPLNDRAWVAQERTLSPAIIHYTQEQMWWECNQVIASESFPEGQSSGFQFWESTEGSGRDRIRSLSNKSDRKDIYSFWRTFISTYASMGMSYHKDRFPAVVGIARLISELIDDNIVAGFWEGDLLHSLLMHRMVYTHRAVLPVQLAPSWSWMSFSATLMLTCFNESALEPLNGVSIIVLSDIPGFKSDLQLPSLEKSGVRGLAIRGALRRLLDGFDKQSGWYRRVDTYDDNRKPAKLRRDTIPQEQSWRFNPPTHMLLLAREPIWDAAGVYGLLVQLAEVEGTNTFRRCGSIEFDFGAGEKVDEYFGLVEKDGKYKPSLFFEESGLQDLVLI